MMKTRKGRSTTRRTAGRMEKTERKRGRQAIEERAPGGVNATFFLPHDVIDAIESASLSHVCLDGKVARSKSRYVADLVRRDADTKKKRPRK